MAIGINIGGQPGTISAATVRDSLDDLVQLLNDASAASGIGRQTWVIENLGIGSAVMAATAAGEAPAADLLRKGLSSLRKQAVIPDGWTPRMVERIRDLGQRVGRGGATEMTMTGLGPAIALSGDIAAHAERALGAATVSYGSVRGKVDRWNEHDRREVKVTLSDSTSATLKYPKELAARILEEALRNTIDAWGLIERDPLGQILSVKVDDFAIVPDREPVPVGSLRGVWADDDGGPWFTLDEWLKTRGD